MSHYHRDRYGDPHEDESLARSSYRDRYDSSQDHRNYDHRETDYYPSHLPPRPQPPPNAPRQPRAFVPYREHDDRSVTPPPSQKPSDEYLALADRPPSTLSDEDKARKLIILDLNGTLVHRAAPPPRAKYRYGVDDRPRDANGNVLPRTRPVHPRPYMPSFLKYIFSPETKQWLDVMVWSSAQPHSVDDMVEKTFGNAKHDLLAVWARDTFGLSNDLYNRKVQTFKDLTKPWSALAELDRKRQQRGEPSSESSSPSSSPVPPSSDLPSSSDPPSSSTPPSSPPPPTSSSAPPHSALTTLLLDDSPRKAELQPYNHICMPEYDGTMRAKDLELLETERARAAERQEAADADAAAQAEAASSSSPPPEGQTGASPERQDGEPEHESSKKRKRQRKKKRRAQLLSSSRNPDSLGPDGYDPTLLAVVGILDEVRKQANVAAWIKSGGLWGPPEIRAREEEDRAAAQAQEDRESTATPPETVTGGKERTGTGQASSSGSDMSMDSELDAKRNGRKEKKRQKKKERDSPEGDITRTDLPINSDNAANSPPPVDGDGANQERTDETHASSTPSMWFEHPTVLRYWATRGKEVLDRMHIPIEHGIEK